MSVYNNNTPLATDLISASQAVLNTNFAQLSLQFGVDHVPFNNSGINGNGHHKQVTIDTPIADPSTAGSVGTFYTKTVSGKVQPIFINATKTAQLAGDNYSYTPVLVDTGVTFTYSSQIGGYFVAGGVTFVFGTIVCSAISGTASGTLTLSLPSVPLYGGSGTIQYVSPNSSLLPSACFLGPVSAGVITFPAARFLSNGSSSSFYFNGFYM